MQSDYLSDFRKMSAETTRGCIMLERPDKVKEFVEKHDAPDGTARKTALPELEAMQNRPSQWNRVEQVPEKTGSTSLPKNISSAILVPTKTLRPNRPWSIDRNIQVRKGD